MNYFARLIHNGAPTKLQSESLDDLKVELAKLTSLPVETFDKATEDDPDKLLILGGATALAAGTNRIHIYRGWQ